MHSQLGRQLLAVAWLHWCSTAASRSQIEEIDYLFEHLREALSSPLAAKAVPAKMLARVASG